jgi:plasmid stability protein
MLDAHASVEAAHGLSHLCVVCYHCNHYDCVEIMAAITIRNLPDDVHRALRVQAARNGRSTEAEVREILATAVKPENRAHMGQALSQLGRRLGLTGADLSTIKRDRKPAKPLPIE